MAQIMARLSVCLLLLLMVGVVAEAVPNKPKQVKCKDKSYPNCYHQKLLCPDSCLRTCVVDCATCQPACTLPPPPPPSPPPPPPKVRQHSPPPPKTYHPPPPPPKVLRHSPPPPKTYHSPPPPPKVRQHSPPPPKIYHSPPPPPPPRKVLRHSPPPPPKTYNHSPPPPPKVFRHSPPPPKTYHSPPPPPKGQHSPPPPKTYPSPPPTTSTPPLSPPPTTFPSPPPPAISIPSPPPPPTTSTPPLSPPPTTFPSPPPPSISISSPPPPTTSTPPSSSPPPAPITSTPPSWYPPPPPASSEGAAKRVKCKNKYYPHCYDMELTCPSSCPSQCEVDCVTCSPVCNCNRPGAVCQDPRFIGGDGITFYFHGKKDRDFCIVSDSNLHINAHFIGRRNQNMKRDFTWVQSLGILFDTHKLFIGAKKTSTWDDSNDRLSLAFNEEPIFLPNGEGAVWQSADLPRITITRSRDTNAVEIEVEGNFKIKATVVPITEKDSRIHNYGITQEDCFAHLDLSFKFYALSGDVNGVLGQTYASNYVSRVKMGVIMPVLGGEKEFASSSLFATDCSVGQFSGQFIKGNSSENYEFANLNCASGMDGRGVVCKR